MKQHWAAYQKYSSFPDITPTFSTNNYSVDEKGSLNTLTQFHPNILITLVQRKKIDRNLKKESTFNCRAYLIVRPRGSRVIKTHTARGAPLSSILLRARALRNKRRVRLRIDYISRGPKIKRRITIARLSIFTSFIKVCFARSFPSLPHRCAGEGPTHFNGHSIGLRPRSLRRIFSCTLLALGHLETEQFAKLGRRFYRSLKKTSQRARSLSPWPRKFSTRRGSVSFCISLWPHDDNAMSSRLRQRRKHTALRCKTQLLNRATERAPGRARKKPPRARSSARALVNRLLRWQSEIRRAISRVSHFGMSGERCFQFSDCWRLKKLISEIDLKQFHDKLPFDFGGEYI